MDFPKILLLSLALTRSREGAEVLYQPVIMRQESMVLGRRCRLVKHGEDALVNHMEMEFSYEVAVDFTHVPPGKS